MAVLGCNPQSRVTLHPEHFNPEPDKLKILARLRAATKYPTLVVAARYQLSALSVQLLNKFRDFSRFTGKNFFAFCKEVTDKDSNRFTPFS
jgi:hypothetical protein